MTVSLKFPAVPYTTSTVLGGSQFFNGFFLGNKMRGFNFRPLAAAVKHTDRVEARIPYKNSWGFNKRP